MFSTASLPANPDITQRLIDQQCTVQWRGFLQALAAEFAAALPPEDLRADVPGGRAVCGRTPLPACATLDDLQHSMAAVWDRIGWGGVRLHQAAAQLDIHHDLSPLSAAFGPGHAPWSGGFLEGVYQSWFEQAGAAQLRVAQSAPADAWGCIHFQLAR